MRLNVVVLLVVLVGMGCGGEERRRLEGENTALKARVASLDETVRRLQETVRRLQETDQAYLAKAVELLKAAHAQPTVANLRAASEAYADVIAKFPASPSVPAARERLNWLLARIKDAIKVEQAQQQMEAAVAAGRFDDARASVEQVKLLIGAATYERLVNRIDEEKSKPTETTINRLVSTWGTREGKRELGGDIGLGGRRVKVDATFASIDRNRKSLNAYSDGWAKGSSLTVFYGGSNLEGHFTDNDPKCCGNRYTVIGTLRVYSNSDDIYIKADRIDVISH
jgi:hypothetical protein